MQTQDNVLPTHTEKNFMVNNNLYKISCYNKVAGILSLFTNKNALKAKYERYLTLFKFDTHNKL